jgi:hypothetical protein
MVLNIHIGKKFGMSFQDRPDGISLGLVRIDNVFEMSHEMIHQLHPCVWKSMLTEKEGTGDQGPQQYPED